MMRTIVRGAADDGKFGVIRTDENVVENQDFVLDSD